MSEDVATMFSFQMLQLVFLSVYLRHGKAEEETGTITPVEAGEERQDNYCRQANLGIQMWSV
jgi:hypothetical protein